MELKEEEQRKEGPPDKNDESGDDDDEVPEEDEEEEDIDDTHGHFFVFDPLSSFTGLTRNWDPDSVLRALDLFEMMTHVPGRRFGIFVSFIS